MRALAAIMGALSLTLSPNWSARAAFTDAQGDQRGGLVAAGFKRTYLLHVPAAYDGHDPLPLLIVLHGTSGQGGDAARITGFSAIADREGFLVVYPDSLVLPPGSGTFRWIVHDEEGYYDVVFIEALISHLEAQFTIAPGQVYAAGMSNGGFFTYVLGCEMGSRLAAIATVIAGMERTVVHHCARTTPLPVLMITGTADLEVPMIGSALTLSSDEIRDFWLKMNGCSRDFSVQALPQTDSNRLMTTRLNAWTHCNGDSEVLHYVMDGGDHSWPGYPIPWKKATCEQVQDCPAARFSASETIWTFFKKHKGAGTITTGP
ncbi:MAG TPA: PHB depolymerase family esterase [Aggregatilineales bacterium]|nr:PHB depolymerase family esterase [Aggregatilineales bacterium]